MPKFIISWEVGNFGENHEIVEAKTLEEAQDWASEAAYEEAQSLVSSNAEEYSKQKAVDLGLEEEEDFEGETEETSHDAT
jgi:hypothetical protein